MYRLGWNHGCKHLIYKDNSTPWYEHEGSYVEPDVYFNRIFIGIGPQSIRRSTLKKQTFTKNKRLTWYLEAAHYLESIGSIFDSDSLSGGHDWKWDFELHLKYPLLVNNSAALFLNNNTTLLLDGDTETFWRDLAELELMFGKGELGSSVFVGINLVDEHPRDSREGIGEAGFRFFF